ncbi:MAG: trypsin-like serine protease [Deltaproteobacteria bacterium]|nr:trypsin-like serine protease [Deltaproteobacteria bacterium]
MKNIFSSVIFLTFLSFFASCQENQPLNTETISTNRPIFYGDPDTSTAHKAVVYLESNTGFSCTGTVIAPTWVLTAGHCVEGVSSIDVKIGNSSYSYDYSVASVDIIQHPNYVGTSQNIYNDIALIELESDVSSVLNPIPILPPSLAISDSDERSTMLEFVGYGLTETYSSGVKLTVDHVLGDQCSSSNYCSIQTSPYSIPPGSISYGQNGGGPCSGDSGGPAFVVRSGTEYVAGVTSYGDEDCLVYGVSTKVDYFYNWITSYTGTTTSTENCTNGTDDDGDGAVDCSDSDCFSNSACQTTENACGNTITLGCGDSVSSSTATGAYTAYTSYNCLDGWTEDGPERIYELLLNTGADVTITLSSGSTNDLDLLILEGNCDTNSCATGSVEDAGVDEVLSFPYDGSSTLYAVVETFQNAGDFTLTVECDGGEVQENCTNGTDDDGDNMVDCNDPDCSQHSNCTTTGENCTNGVDDDGDNMVDCNDPDCQTNANCITNPENCTNGVDDDGDGAVDCDDADCVTLSSCTERVEDCTNGIDDDGDGAADCDDVDCANNANCSGTISENCSNGIDDDGDAKIDCNDSDCRTFSACQAPVEICYNGTDDDGDGLTDCNDSDCASYVGCGMSGGEICYNGIDDDGDGKTDCGDSDCASYSKCSNYNSSSDDGGCSCSNAGSNVPPENYFFIIILLIGLASTRKLI